VEVSLSTFLLALFIITLLLIFLQPLLQGLTYFSYFFWFMVLDWYSKLVKEYGMTTANLMILGGLVGFIILVIGIRKGIKAYRRRQFVKKVYVRV